MALAGLALLFALATSDPPETRPADPPPAASASPPSSDTWTPRGWVGVGGRNAFALGLPLSPDFGVEAIGGAWLLDQHLHPIASLGWSHGFGQGIAIDAFRFGAGLGAGAALWDQRVWLGGALELAGVATWARAGGVTTTGIGSVLETSAILYFRLAHRVLLGTQFGPEVSLPTLHFGPPSAGLQWGPARFNAGLRLGVVFG
jgi:hypothetical protein